MTTVEDQIRAMLKTWNRFPATDEADFNCLVREVSEALNRGTDQKELALVIHNEFYSHFGTQGPRGDVQDVAEEILVWWETRREDSS